MLKSSLGCFAVALLVFAVWILLGVIYNWYLLIFLIPAGLVALAAYLNFGPKPKPPSDRPPYDEPKS